MTKLYEEGFNPGDLKTKVSEMLVATADSSDQEIDSSVSEALRALRQRLQMDVVFVSEFVDGQRVFRFVDTAGETPLISAGHSEPLEQTWCQLVVDERIPQFIPDATRYSGEIKLPALGFEVGTFLSTPILLGGGQIYGTLCCFSFSHNEQIQQTDLKYLKSAATMIARRIDTTEVVPPRGASPTKTKLNLPSR